MDEKKRQEDLDLLKKRLKRKFDELAVPMNKVEFTQENYDKLFPNSKVSTPIGEVNLGGHQFEKLYKEKRQKYLGAMHQTLIDPIAVIKEKDNRGKAQLFSKSFKNDEEKIKGLMSVVIDIDGTRIAISTHRRNPNNIINKIKKAADLVYEKPDRDRTAGNDSKNLAISDDTQSVLNIPQSPPGVKSK
jgi:hypothetical protein